MGINPHLPPDQRKMAILSQISNSLQSIASNIGHEMGPFKVQPVGTIAEQMKPEWDRQAEENRREAEIEELKKSNKIAEKTAKYAVYALVVSVILGMFQLAFSIWQYSNPKDLPSVEVKLIDERQK